MSVAKRGDGRFGVKFKGEEGRSRLYAAMIRLISSWISACRVDLFSHEGLMGMSSSGTPSQLLMLSTVNWTAARRPSLTRRAILHSLARDSAHP